MEVKLSGDLGYFRVVYTLKATPKVGGEPNEDEGKCIFIVKKQQNNSWKIERLLDNSESDNKQPGL